MSKNPYDSDFGAVFKQRYEKDILGKRDIKKGGIFGKIAGGVAANALFPANPLATGIGVGAGDEIEHGLTGKAIKSEKMAKGTGYLDNEYNRLNPVNSEGPTGNYGESLPPNRKQPMQHAEEDPTVNEDEDLENFSVYRTSKMEKEEPKKYRVVDTGLKGERVGETRVDSGMSRGSDVGAHVPAPKKQQTFDSKRGFVAKAELRKAVNSIDRVLAKCGEGATAGMNIKKVTQSKDGTAFPQKSVPKPVTKKGNKGV